MGGSYSLVGDDATAFLQYVGSKTPGMDPRLCVLSAEDIEEAATVAGLSFAGTATTDPEFGIDWACGSKLKEQWENVTAHALG